MVSDIIEISVRMKQHEKFSCGDKDLNGMCTIVSKHHMCMVYCLCYLICKILICTTKLFITESALIGFALIIYIHVDF